MAVLRCPSCGKRVRARDRFCPECGLEVRPEAGRVCPECGRIQDEGNYCENCGAPLTQSRKKDGKVRRALLRAAAVLLIAAVLLSIVAVIAGKGIKGAGSIASSLSMAVQGRTAAAVRALEDTDTAFACWLSGMLADRAYARGVKCYRDGDYGAATGLFEVTGDRGRSADYRLLLNAHSPNYYYNEVSAARMVEQILGMWEFEDAPAALVANRFVAMKWMSGQWESEDGKTKARMDIDGHFSYNMPRTAKGDTYTIKDGKVLLYYKGDQDNAEEAFVIYPMGEDAVCFYCCANGKYYNLRRVSDSADFGSPSLNS